MKCPQCGEKKDKIKVVDSRPTEAGSIRRRRECETCGHRFSTTEALDTTNSKVIKRDATRQKFDTQKLRASIEVVTDKLAIPDDQIEYIVNDVKNRALATKTTEVSSAAIARWVMQHLLSLDPIAYTRYASFYREFKDAGVLHRAAGTPAANPDQRPLFATNEDE